MAKKNKVNRTKQNYPIGKQAVKQEPEKHSDFYTKHKSTIWTVIVLVILTIFFIINNTRKVPDEGPYPPNYLNENSSDINQE
jgi:uncharacterized integral membrane protein